MRWLLLAGLTGVALANDKALDLPEIVARINGTSITRMQFEARLAQSRSMNPERFDNMTAVERNQAMLRTLNSIVVRELEAQEAEKHGIKIADEELERGLNELKAHARTPGGLEKMLAEYRITLDQRKEEARRTLLIQKIGTNRSREAAGHGKRNPRGIHAQLLAGKTPSPYRR